MAWDPEFEVAFHPQTVAVVGATRSRLRVGDFVGNLKRAGFPGRIYPINPKAVGQEIHGLKVYPDLASLPEPIDLVIISVPAAVVPTVLEECIAVNAKNVHIFSAGFGETGEEKGIELEQKLAEIARRGGLRIVGPNCMGLHVPAPKLTPWPVFSPEPGPVAFLSQSGGHAGMFVSNGERFGIHFSKVVSFGNAIVLDSIDFLEYLATDPETGIICMYLEGVRDGNKLTKMVREINRKKPVILWKGGLTKWGAKAVASHTGSLGGEKEIWDAFYRQTGAVRIDSLEELYDVTMTFLTLPPLKSRRIALLGAGGGNSVAAADICARAGLELPTLTEKTLKELRSFIPPEGTIITNPLDLGVVLQETETLLRSMGPVAADPLIDSIILALPVRLFAGGILSDLRRDKKAFLQAVEKQYRQVRDFLIDFAHGNAERKPLMMVLDVGMAPTIPGITERAQQDLIAAGIPVYADLERLSRAVYKFAHYHEYQRKAQDA